MHVMFFPENYDFLSLKEKYNHLAPNRILLLLLYYFRAIATSLTVLIYQIYKNLTEKSDLFNDMRILPYRLYSQQIQKLPIPENQASGVKTGLRLEETIKEMTLN